MRGIYLPQKSFTFKPCNPEWMNPVRMYCTFLVHTVSRSHELHILPLVHTRMKINTLASVHDFFVVSRGIPIIMHTFSFNQMPCKHFLASFPKQTKTSKYINKINSISPIHIRICIYLEDVICSFRRMYLYLVTSLSHTHSR